MKFNIGLIFIILLIACGQSEVNFDKERWSNSKDGSYNDREKMVTDLIENRLKKGMQYNEVIDLLGEGNYHEPDSTKVIYTIMVDYGWDIDPVKGKNLCLQFNTNSVLVDFELVKWKKGFH